jgi:hypothetical protein
MWRVDWAWRRLVPLIALALACYAVVGLSGKVDKTTDALQRQKDGRRVALEVICGSIKGVEDAGRRILTGTLPPPASMPPPRSARERRLASQYAEAYSRVISESVLAQAGAKATGVLKADGSLDCDALKRATSVAQAVPDP